MYKLFVPEQLQILIKMYMQGITEMQVAML